MHVIQRKILEKLLYAESLSYAQMRPANTESNLYAYHLEQLVKAKIIVKHDRQYSLSPLGLALVDRLSQGKMVERLQPHIVTAIDLTNAKGETLLYKRLFQPYIYRLGFPLGKLHLEENIEAAAIRELQEKTGLENIPLAHRGMVYIEARQAGYTISKVLYHIFHGEVGVAEPSVVDQRGSCLWATPNNYTAQELMPGFSRVKELLSSSSTSELFFDEICQEL